ncbi:IS3 family transposase [Sulfurifustis variabilis]|uniref:IS3 family transposase n=1 Tax=Sulfurifustis variabilis TaxID=1675686 RepID=UPI000BBB2EE0|nr:IS3 family transposase [Sulfurifustis variabilis]
MKKSRFTESQIVAILREAESGVPVNEIWRRHGISSATYYKWKAKYGGLDVAELKRMKELETENARLKRMFAELSLENHALKDLIPKKALSPAERRESAAYLVGQHGLAVRRACTAVGLSRAAYYRVPVPAAERDREVIAALSGVVERHHRWGFWMCFDHLKRVQNHPWNHKRVWRVYRALKLNLPRRTKKRLPKRDSLPLQAPSAINTVWALDFMSDALYRGRTFRLLNILDEGAREALAIEVDTNLPAERVIRVLEQLKAWRGLPKRLRLDNGPEFTAQRLVKWCAGHGIELAYIAPGKPNQNAFVERFNRSLRHELLDAYLFEDLDQVREMVWWWLCSYNAERPHRSLNRIPPMMYRQQVLERRSSTSGVSA